MHAITEYRAPVDQRIHAITLRSADGHPSAILRDQSIQRVLLPQPGARY